MHLITGMLMIMATVKLVTVRVLPKNLIGLQQINKANKAIRWSFHISKSLQLIPLALSIQLNFTHPNIRIANLDEHTIIHSCGIVDLRIGMSNHFHKLIFKTLQYTYMKVLKGYLR